MTTRPPMLAADHIRELVKPYATHEVINDTPTSRIHTVHHPSLLNQLRNATHGSTNLSDNDASRSIATSKPTAHLEAIDILARIDKQSRELATECGAGNHKRLEDRLAAISGQIGDEPHHKIRSWWAAARLATHHDTPPIRPHGVPCMNCWELNTLRIRLEDEIATCNSCGEVWDRTGTPGHGSLDTLGQHVKWCTEHEITKARHWQTDAEGYPVECVECLVLREELATIRHAQAGRVDNGAGHAS